MPTTDVIRETIWEDAAIQCLARVTGLAGAAITQTSLSSITYKIFDLNGATPNTPISSGTLTIASVVFDALQTDARWTLDTTGYNFRHAHVPTAFPIGDHTYRIEYVFTPTNGDAFPGVFEVYAKAVRGG